MATTLITGRTVVTATGRSAADVLVDGEVIVGVLAPGSRCWAATWRAPSTP